MTEKHSKRWITALTVVVIVVMFLPYVCSAQEVTIAKKKEPLTPQTDMIRDILENTKWGVSDRAYEALYQAEMQLQNIRRKVKSLRASLIMSSSEATEEQLSHYLKASQLMVDIKKSLETIQTSISSCTGQCAKVEMAAAEGKPLPPEPEKIDKMTESGVDAAMRLKKTVNDLQEVATELEDKKLKGVADELTVDADQLQKAVTICQSCMKQTSKPMTEEEGKEEKKEKKEEKKQEKSEE